MIAPSSLGGCAPGLLATASGGALIDFTSIISLFRHFVKPISMIFSWARFFFYRVFYTHILAIMYAV